MNRSQHYQMVFPELQKARVVINHFAQLESATEKFGMLLPHSVAAVSAGLSRQRIHFLVKQGRLTNILLYGQHVVSHRELVGFLGSRRLPVKIQHIEAA